MINKLKRKIFSQGTKIKNIVSPSSFYYLKGNRILLYYSDFNDNWGDAVNPFIFEKITGKKIISSKRIFNYFKKDRISGIGSILGSNLKGKVIWGSGFIKLPCSSLVSPEKILALRGRKSGQIMSDNNIPDPGIYGDPALLFSEFYKPNISKKFKIGIVPHYTEVEEFQNSSELIINKDVSIISPIVKDKNFYDFIDRILECEKIISSSLHGLIMADAYGIPTLRFTFKNQIIGGDFKYDDYYSGVGIFSHKKIHIESPAKLNINEICEKTETKVLDYNPIELKNSLLAYVENEWR